MANPVSVGEVLKLKEPTKNFLCPLSANTHGIEFLAFKIRDVDSRRTIFEVSKDASTPPPQFPPDFDFDQLRTIHYKFPAEFLRLKTVGTTLRFSVGPKEVRNFRMIERHYFKTKLVKSYDFNFQFCIPNSTNEWEAIYDMPKLSESEVNEMMTSPGLTRSDSFYFVEGQLIMHNKASYSYVVANEGDRKTATATVSPSSSSNETATATRDEAAASSSSQTVSSSDRTQPSSDPAASASSKKEASSPTKKK